MTEAPKPTLLWDGDCTFCAHWIERWQRWTGPSIDYRPYQQSLEEFPQVREDQCRRAVQLVLPDGTVCAGAHAVLQSLALAGRHDWMLGLYRRSAFFRGLAEATYGFVARNRDWLPRI